MELDHKNGSLIQETVEKRFCGCSVSIFQMPQKPDFQFRLFDVGFVKPIPNQLVFISTVLTFAIGCGLPVAVLNVLVNSHRSIVQDL